MYTKVHPTELLNLKSLVQVRWTKKRNISQCLLRVVDSKGGSKGLQIRNMKRSFHIVITKNVIFSQKTWKDDNEYVSKWLYKFYEFLQGNTKSIFSSKIINFSLFHLIKQTIFAKPVIKKSWSSTRKSQNNERYSMWKLIIFLQCEPNAHRYWLIWNCIKCKCRKYYYKIEKKYVHFILWIFSISCLFQ